MKNRGFTIIQILVVLFVFATIVSASYGIYSKKNDQIITEEIVDDFLEIKNALIEHYMDRLSYAGLTESYAFSQGIFSSTMQMNYENDKCFTRLRMRCKARILDSDVIPTYLNQNDGFVLVISPIPDIYCFAMVSELAKHFEFVDMGGHVVKSHTVNYTGAVARNECTDLLENTDGTSRVRVAHY